MTGGICLICTAQQEAATLRVRLGEVERDRDAYRDALAKEWGKTLIPEDTEVRPASRSYMKPSEFALFFAFRLSPLPSPPEPQ